MKTTKPKHAASKSMLLSLRGKEQTYYNAVHLEKP
jgi:hypothetical protein